MAIRFTTWVSTVLAQLSGADVDAGDRIAIYDAGAGTTKYLDPTEIADIPEVAAAIAAAGGSAPDAADVVFAPAAGIAATDVQAAIEEAAGDLTAHLADTSDAHDASAISFSPASGIAATDVQAAIVEDAGDLAAHLADTSDAHDASAISVADAGSLITATEAEAALQEAFNGSFAVNTNATTGSTETLTLAPAHKMTMDQNCTFTFPTPTTNGHYFELWLLGAFTPTFPASVDWHGSAAPTYVNDSLYGFTTLDGGTTWIGALIGSNLG